MLAPLLTPTPLDRPPIPARTRVCQACGVSDRSAAMTSFVVHRGVYFYLACWQTLPGAAIRRVEQDIQGHSV